jgi:hypothetical protein
VKPSNHANGETKRGGRKTGGKNSKREIVGDVPNVDDEFEKSIRQVSKSLVLSAVVCMRNSCSTLP